MMPLPRRVLQPLLDGGIDRFDVEASSRLERLATLVAKDGCKAAAPHKKKPPRSMARQEGVEARPSRVKGTPSKAALLPMRRPELRV
jgi:hypothetical protein